MQLEKRAACGPLRREIVQINAVGAQKCLRKRREKASALLRGTDLRRFPSIGSGKKFAYHRLDCDRVESASKGFFPGLPKRALLRRSEIENIMSNKADCLSYFIVSKIQRRLLIGCSSLKCVDRI